jgi:UDP-N-acetyl-D-mannosaminuronate dehydrogenase
MNLLERINTKQAHIGVIGLGYVGLPLVIEFCKTGNLDYAKVLHRKTINPRKGLEK